MKFTNKMKVAFGIALFAALMLICPNVASAQALNASTSVGLTLNMNVSEQLTVSATPSSVQFNGSTGTITGNSPVTITTTYVLNKQTRNTVKLYAYFANASALTGQTQGGIIQNSQVAAQIDGGSYQTCNMTGIGSAFDCLGGYLVASSAMSAARWPAATSVDTMNLQITLGSNPVDTYTGTLNITAQAL